MQWDQILTQLAGSGVVGACLAAALRLVVPMVVARVSAIAADVDRIANAAVQLTGAAADLTSAAAKLADVADRLAAKVGQ